MESDAWKDTFQLLNNANDDDRNVIARYADVNWNIAADTLKNMWTLYSLFLAPFVGFLIAHDLWKKIFGLTSILAAIFILFVGLQTFIGYLRASQIKMCIDSYTNGETHLPARD
jgi:hypothetical protein